jgi:uncharacterized repeat protein (TIGR01451 family)
LTSVETRFLDDTGSELATFFDEVYFSSLTTLLGDSPEKAEVTYTFLALLPRVVTICPYAGIEYNSNTKYDEAFCSQDAMITIDGDITLNLDKQVNLMNVEQGQILEYTIAYSNTGDLDLQYTWIWDDVPADTVSIITSSISPVSDPDETTAGRVAWDLGTIPVSTTGVLSFSVLVDGNGEDISDDQDVVNVAEFGISTVGLPNNAALTSTAASTVQAPTITMSKTDGQSEANPGDLLTYVIEITYSGSIPAAGLVITDELPLNVSLAGPTIPNYNSKVDQTLIWNVASLAAVDGTLAITIPIQVDPELSEDFALTNIGEISYQNAAGHTFSPQTVSDLTFVTVPTTTLSFSKTAEDLNGEPLVVGDTIRYTLQVTNTGAFTAYNVTVTDTLPAEVSCQSVSAGGLNCADNPSPLIWDVGTLASDEVATLTIDVMIKPEGEGQSIVNSASVTATNVVDPTPDPAVCPDGSEPTDNTCPETPISGPELVLSKTAEDLDGAPLVVSDTVRYTLQVTNTGAYTAFNVTVTDDLPDEVECQSVSEGPNCEDDPLIWNVGDLGPDITASLLITVVILPDAAGQSIVNSASVTATNVVDPTPDPAVCPDGSEPNEGVCEEPVEPLPSPEDNPNVYLPIIMR